MRQVCFIYKIEQSTFVPVVLSKLWRPPSSLSWSDLGYEDGSRKILQNDAINIQESTMSRAPMILQSGYVTPVEMAKLSVRLNFAYCGRSASHSRLYGRFFFIITSTKSLGPSPNENKGLFIQLTWLRARAYSVTSIVVPRLIEAGGRLSSVNIVT